MAVDVTTGSDDDETIVVTDTDATVAAGAGDDLIFVGPGNSTIFGGEIDFDIAVSSGDFSGGLNTIVRVDGQTGAINTPFDNASAPPIEGDGFDGLTLLNDPRDVFLDGPFGALSTTVLINTGFVPPAPGNDLTIEFTQDGAFIDVFAELGDSGFFVDPGGAVFGPGGDIFVGSRTEGTVFQFDGETGEFVPTEGIPTEGFFDPAAIDFPRGFVFGPDGTLFIGNGSNPVTGEGEDNIFAVDPITRELTVFAAPEGFSPLDVILSPDGTQLVVSSEFPFTGGSLADANPGSIFIFDIATGEVDAILDPGLDENGDPILLAPRGLGFAPDGTLFSSSTGNGNLLQFDVETGEFLGIFATLFETDADGVVTANLNGQGFDFVLPEGFDGAEGGNDTASFLNIGTGVAADLTTGLADFTDTNDIAFQSVLIGIENLDGTTVADTLTGDDGANLIFADSGADTVVGGGGDDTLLGNSGTDLITGGAGDDLIVGGVGADILEGEDGDDDIAGAIGTDALSGGAGSDAVAGGLSDDTIVGGDGDDTIIGGGGADDIEGSDGDDSIGGAFGSDTIYGGEGNDTIRGGLGEDTLIGGADDDLLTGGMGADVFVFGMDTGTDVITDFNLEEDQLDLIFTVVGASDAIANSFQTDEGLLFGLGDGNSVLLLGIDQSDFGADNLV